MKTFYFHPVVVKKRKKNKQRRATVAAIFDEDSQQFKFGVAICSEKDQFLKKYGRDAALGQAWSKNPAWLRSIPEGSLVDTTEQQALTKFFVKAAIDLLDGEGYIVLPKHVKEAA